MTALIMRCVVLGLAVASLITAQRYPNQSTKPKSMKNKLIFIVIDGIRYDFYDLATNLPNLFAMSRKGARSAVTPPFPSHSTNCMTTLMTGLYFESHGMTGRFFDPATGEFVKTNDEHLGKMFNTEEPIWRTNEKQGGKCIV